MRAYTPVEMNKTISKGSRKFQLNFYHANYPAGVQSSSYVLKILNEIGTLFLSGGKTNKSVNFFFIRYSIFNN